MFELFNEVQPNFISEFSASPGDEDDVIDDEENLIEEEPVNTGIDLGKNYKEDAEQDLDDLIHTPGGKDYNKIPPPEDL